ncbi:unnamed protein product [Paramecium sonneborni]|uniref:Uncharacterized protein n=1 Tax=Paramecium sonneborni TaxID=65129 RepID=A0A8S1RG94_9CILI|nr:unnamed protein product [Paramecium sonneborni]
MHQDVTLFFKRTQEFQCVQMIGKLLFKNQELKIQIL